VAQLSLRRFYVSVRHVYTAMDNLLIELRKPVKMTIEVTADELTVLENHRKMCRFREGKIPLLYFLLFVQHGVHQVPNAYGSAKMCKSILYKTRTTKCKSAFLPNKSGTKDHSRRNSRIGISKRQPGISVIRLQRCIHLKWKKTHHWILTS
jgi:hypothetical protein